MISLFASEDEGFDALPDPRLARGLGCSRARA